MRLAAAGCGVLLTLVTTLSAEPVLAQYEPARFRFGPTPPLPPVTVIDAGHVWLRVSVDTRGYVDGVETLEPAPFFEGLMRDTVQQWTFAPATDRGTREPSEVLVAGLFRSASLYSVGPRIRPPATRLSSRSSPIPIPQVTETPQLPPNVVGSGIVVVEVTVRVDGGVDQVAAVRSQGGFDRPAIDAARRWRFQPARRDGQPVESVAYLVFGFREPVVTDPQQRDFFNDSPFRDRFRPGG